MIWINHNSCQRSLAQFVPWTHAIWFVELLTSYLFSSVRHDEEQLMLLAVIMFIKGADCQSSLEVILVWDRSRRKLSEYTKVWLKDIVLDFLTVRLVLPLGQHQISLFGMDFRFKQFQMFIIKTPTQKI